MWSTVISQDCTPAPAIEPSRKKPKNSSIVRLISRSRPDSVGPACVGLVVNLVLQDATLQHDGHHHRYAEQPDQ